MARKRKRGRYPSRGGPSIPASRASAKKQEKKKTASKVLPAHSEGGQWYNWGDMYWWECSPEQVDAIADEVFGGRYFTTGD